MNDTASPMSSNTVHERIRTMIGSQRVFLFMKGSVSFPMCGFSGRAVSMLKEAQARYATFDVLSDDEIRQGVKTFAHWPTIPQLYVDGEFVGGSDIMAEMHASGELAELVAPEQK